MTTTNTIDLTTDIIDVRDIIARVEELANDLTTYSAEAHANPELVAEHAALCAILADIKGLGGDEQWEGDWYPLTLIRESYFRTYESYFRTYAEELADDIGAIPRDAQWPLTCIDWEQAARELRYDYSPIDIDGVTYWTR